MKNPPHPGEVIRELCNEPLGLTVTATKGLSASRKALSEQLGDHSGISPDTAIRLAKAFGGSAEGWLRQQMAYDLAKAEKHADKIVVKRFKLV